MTTIDDFARAPLGDEARELFADFREELAHVPCFSAEQLESMSDKEILRVLAETAAKIARLKALQARGTAFLDRR